VRTRTWDDEFRLACALGKASTVEMLRYDLDEEDFEVDCDTQHGYCGIHAAALHGHDTVVQLLLEWKSDINKQTEAGMTPLLYAACSGHTHVVEELMLHGAEEYHVIPSVNKELERSAYDLADQFDYEDILSLFQQFKREGGHSVDSDLRNAGNASKKMKKSRSGASSRSRSSQGSSRSGSSSQSGISGQTGSETSSKKDGLNRKASSATLASATPATRKASSATLTSANPATRKASSATLTSAASATRKASSATLASATSATATSPPTSSSRTSATTKASFKDAKKKIKNSMNDSPNGDVSAASASSKTSKSTAS